MKKDKNNLFLPHDVSLLNFYDRKGVINKWGITSNYSRPKFLNEEQSNSIISIINKFKSSKNKIDSKDTIHTNSLSDVPRFKLKEYIKENNIKRTSRVEQSNCIIMSRKIFNELIPGITLENITFVNKDLAGRINKTIKFNEYYPNLLPDAYDKNQFYCIPPYLEKLNNNIKTDADWGTDFISNSYIVKGCIVDLYRNARLTDFIELLLFLSKNPKVKLVFDETLFESLNQEGIELDDEYESTLRDMIFSEDKTNIKLGVEMISNLVINDYTILKISLLLNEFAQNRRLTEITTYSQSNRNFRTLLNILKSKQILWRVDWKTFAAGLRKNFNNGKEGEAVKSFIINNLNTEFNKTIKGLKIEDIKFGV
jgi:hypothetical protein